MDQTGLEFDIPGVCGQLHMFNQNFLQLCPSKDFSPGALYGLPLGSDGGTVAPFI